MLAYGDRHRNAFSQLQPKKITKDFFFFNKYIYLYKTIYYEVSRGALEQACDCKRLVGLIHTRGNEIFYIFISSLWYRGTPHKMPPEFSGNGVQKCFYGNNLS